jgi:DNA polymerase-4
LDWLEPTPINNPDKVIIHVDMDCFYAAVEMRDNPQYRHVPLAIGGKSPRSVLCTANYKAREYGVRAAQPTQMALKKCPELVIVPPNFTKYKEASNQIHKVFNMFTSLVQPLSLDEAYLDVTQFSNFHGISGFEIAKLIKEHINKSTNLTASAGISHLKYLAKIASDWNKPNGIFEIQPHEVIEFLNQLEVKHLPGVGPVTLNKLNQLGIYNCQDLRKTGELALNQSFGKYGKRLLQLSHGIDSGIVKTDRIAKSLSIENTFKNNLEMNELILEIPDLTEEFYRRLIRSLRKDNNKQIKSIFVKMKLTNHDKKSLEKTISDFPEVLELLDQLNSSVLDELNSEEAISNNKLLDSIKDRFEVVFSKLAKDIFNRFDFPKIRLFGLGIRYHGKENDIQKLDYYDQLSFELT